MKLNIFNKNDFYLNLTGTEKHILDKINQKPETFISSNISGIAKLINTSPSALTRISKKLGFNSFASLRMYISNEIIKQTHHKTTTGDHELNKLKSLIFYSLDETFESRKLVKSINNVVKDISEKSTFLIYGIESSGLAGQELAISLTKLGLNAHYTNVIDTFIALSHSHKNSIKLLFSNSFRSKRIKLIKKMYPDSVAITSNTEIKGNKINYKIITSNSLIEDTSGKYAQLLIVDIMINRISLKLKRDENISRNIINDL